ncbi:maintenance of mitochondrial structure and function-domain-containing protein [Lipomyces arxii]|uniref:maintenance of mitochondrial structure and function-domain-containing protein n=1 Tax=Lipomyces arxii TaxID=56418 RepID=UPI0034CFCF03
MSFLHLSSPSSSNATPLNVIVHPQALFTILDHTLRRTEGQEPVIGSLLGTRSDDGTEIEIKTSFAVPHTISGSQVEIGMEYHKTMYNLHHKANPKEILVGWYSTSLELNTISALIHYFYSSAPDGTFPHPAVHLTMQTEPSADMTINTYVSTGVGVDRERILEGCLFVPVPHEIRYSEAERSGLDLVASAKSTETRSTSIVSDIGSLEKSIEDVLDMLDRVSAYVSGVVDGTSPANVAIGKYLLANLSLAPKIEPEELERLFNSHLQDVLLVVYLSNSIKTQMELFNTLKRMALVSA